MTALSSPRTWFERPDALTAGAPPEDRGLRRDGVRLLVAAPEGIVHATFAHLADHLEAGDLVVVNTSGTLAAELDVVTAEGTERVLHLATPLSGRTWVVEVRTAPDAARAALDHQPADVLRLGNGTSVTLRAPFAGAPASPTGDGNRLWVAEVSDPEGLTARLSESGRPIAYGYLRRRLPLADYQTVFARHPGSAEMPSAGRPFTPEVVVDLVTQGIAVAPVRLHTGVSSQEAGEPPQPERFHVPGSTARLVNATLDGGGRVVAVGTTVTRALESAVTDDGRAVARSGWTDLLLGPQHPPRLVSGLLTGWHDPAASHLHLVESVAGAVLTQRAYDAAVACGYLWHEFGDSCLFLPQPDPARPPWRDALPDSTSGNR